MSKNAQMPRVRRKDARPAEIVAAARALFIADGFAATKIESIAARAGTAKGSVYRYFPSKDALFEAVVRDAMVSAVDNAADRLFADPQTSAERLLKNYIRGVIAVIASTERIEIVRLVIAELPRFPSLARFYYDSVVAPDLAIIRRIIVRGQATGEFSAAAPLALPELLTMPILMAGLWRATFGPDALDLHAAGEALIAMLLDGWRVR